MDFRTENILDSIDSSLKSNRIQLRNRKSILDEVTESNINEEIYEKSDYNDLISNDSLTTTESSITLDTDENITDNIYDITTNTLNEDDEQNTTIESSKNDFTSTALNPIEINTNINDVSTQKTLQSFTSIKENQRNEIETSQKLPVGRNRGQIRNYNRNQEEPNHSTENLPVRGRRPNLQTSAFQRRYLNIRRGDSRQKSSTSSQPNTLNEVSPELDEINSLPKEKFTKINNETFHKDNATLQNEKEYEPTFNQTLLELSSTESSATEINSLFLDNREEEEKLKQTTENFSSEDYLTTPTPKLDTTTNANEKYFTISDEINFDETKKENHQKTSTEATTKTNRNDPINRTISLKSIKEKSNNQSVRLSIPNLQRTILRSKNERRNEFNLENRSENKTTLSSSNRSFRGSIKFGTRVSESEPNLTTVIPTTPTPTLRKIQIVRENTTKTKERKNDSKIGEMKTTNDDFARLSRRPKFQKSNVAENENRLITERLHNESLRSKSRYRIQLKESEEEIGLRVRPTSRKSLRQQSSSYRVQVKESEEEIGLRVRPTSRKSLRQQNRFEISTTKPENFSLEIRSKPELNRYLSKFETTTAFPTFTTDTTPNESQNSTILPTFDPNNHFYDEVNPKIEKISSINNISNDTDNLHEENMIKNDTSSTNSNENFQNIFSNVSKILIKDSNKEIAENNTTNFTLKFINGRRVKVIKKRRPTLPAALILNPNTQNESVKLKEDEMIKGEVYLQPITEKNINEISISILNVTSTKSLTKNSTNDILNSDKSHPQLPEISSLRRNFKKIIRKIKPISNKKYLTENGTIYKPENDNITSIAKIEVNQELNLKNETLIESDEKGNNSQELGDLTQISEKPKFTSIRKFYRPTKLPTNLKLANELKTTTSRNYIRKYTNNFTLPKPPSEILSRAQEDKNINVPIRPLKLSRERFRSQKRVYKTDKEYEENNPLFSKSQVKVQNFVNKKLLDRPIYRNINRNNVIKYKEENNNYEKSEEENFDYDLPATTQTNNEIASSSPKLNTPNLIVRLNNGFVGYVTKPKFDENDFNIKKDFEYEDKEGDEEEDYEDENFTNSKEEEEQSEEYFESTLPTPSTNFPPETRPTKYINYRPTRLPNRPRIVNRPIFTTVHPASLRTLATTSATPKVTNTKQYTHTYSYTSSTEDITSTEEILLNENRTTDVINTSSKKHFNNTSNKKYITLSKLKQNQNDSLSNTTVQKQEHIHKHMENNRQDAEKNLNNFDTLQESALENSIPLHSTTTQLPSTTTAKPTTLHHIFAIDGDENETTTMLTLTSLKPNDENEKIIKNGQEKLVEISRVVEVYSKEDKLKLKPNNGSEKVPITDLKIEKLPTIDRWGEINRVKFVKLVEPTGRSKFPKNKGKLLIESRSTVADYTPTEPTTSVQSIPVRNAIPIIDGIDNDVLESNVDDKNAQKVSIPEVILGIETSTIALEGLFESTKKGKNIGKENETLVFASSLGESHLYNSNTENPNETTDTSESTKIKKIPKHSLLSIVTKTDKNNYVRPLVPLLRPESNESSPLVISIANLDKTRQPLVTNRPNSRRPILSVRRRLTTTTTNPLSSPLNDFYVSTTQTTLTSDISSPSYQQDIVTTSNFNKYTRRNRPTIFSSSTSVSGATTIKSIISENTKATNLPSQRIKVQKNNDSTISLKSHQKHIVRRKFGINGGNNVRRNSSSTIPPTNENVYSLQTTPRTSNPLFRRRHTFTTSTPRKDLPITTFSPSFSKTLPDSSTHNLSLITDDIDQEAGSSIIQDQKFTNNRYNKIGENLEDELLVDAIKAISRAPIPKISSTTIQYLQQITPQEDIENLTPIQPIKRRIGINNIEKSSISKNTVLNRTIKTTSTTTASPHTNQLSPHRKLMNNNKPFEKIKSREFSGRTYRPVIDYDYYDDEDSKLVGKSNSQVKVILHGPGIIECLDQGNFPHPLSCRKFISCAKMETGGVVGWEYTCPKGLSYDPVGGICNWAAGLGCKE